MRESPSPITPHPSSKVPAAPTALAEATSATRGSNGTSAAQDAAPEAHPSEPRDVVLVPLLFAAAVVLITVAWLAALVLGAQWLLGAIF